MVLDFAKCCKKLVTPDSGFRCPVGAISEGYRLAGGWRVWGAFSTMATHPIKTKVKRVHLRYTCFGNDLSVAILMILVVTGF